jgi:hypothetical protein
MRKIGQHVFHDVDPVGEHQRHPAREAAFAETRSRSRESSRSSLSVEASVQSAALSSSIVSGILVRMQSAVGISLAEERTL